MNLSKRDRAYFRSAQAVSELSDFRLHVGCVVVDKHRIISSGFNREKGHPMQAQMDRATFNCIDCLGKQHAEFSALLPLIKQKVNLSGATIYTYREKKDGTLGMARPCSRCMSLIKSCGIKRIKYTTDDGFASEVLI